MLFKFNVIDSNDQVVAFDVLDTEARIVFGIGKEIKPVAPVTMGIDWYKMFSMVLSGKEYQRVDMAEVKRQLMFAHMYNMVTNNGDGSSSLLSSDALSHLYSETKKMLDPYIQLLDRWGRNGYTFEKVTQ